jgi:cold-inducible RNA-binding protein
VPPVRLFIGNLPYTATEDDLRSHFSAVGTPTQIVRPLDRETGRARGFAFVEYADRGEAEAAVKKFDGQLFMGRPLAVSEARARDDRGPGGPPRPGGPGGFAPRPGGPGGYAPRPGGPGGPGGPPRPGGYGGGGGFAPRPGGFGARPGEPSTPSAAARERNFGPPAPPKGKKKPNPAYAAKERGPKGPIPTKFTGRAFSLDDEAEDDAAAVDIVPEFMKHDEETVEQPEGDRPDSAAPDTAVPDNVESDDEE